MPEKRLEKRMLFERVNRLARRLIRLSIQISHSSLRRLRQLSRRRIHSKKGVKRLPVGSNSRARSTVKSSRPLSLFLSNILSLPVPFAVRARWSNSKNLEDDPIRRRDQRGRYERRKVISHLRSREWDSERAFFSLLHSGDVEWHNLVAIAAVHRAAEIARLHSREIISTRGRSKSNHFYT